MNPIYLHNTATKKKQEFVALNPPQVGLYSCGPTVYSRQHIGNMRSAIFVDILKRTLLINGYDVQHIMNITDVGHLTDDASSGEDKMEKKAKELNTSAWDIAKEITDLYKQDLAKLNILPAMLMPKATDHIAEQIKLISDLEQNGFTYIIDDGVYFDTSKFSSYADFAQLNLEELQDGARVEKNTQKKNPSDFALWKFSPKNEKRQMEWESPWGKGFPGWHLECSAMSMKYLGNTLDIHTGGIEHIPIHHTNEIAQSEAATQKPFSNYWLHNDHLLLGHEKMSKSLNNVVILDDIINKGYSSLDFRFMNFMTHYRKQLSFTYEALDAARSGRERIMHFAKRIFKMLDLDIQTKEESLNYLQEKRNDFLKSLNDDLNTAESLAILFEVIKDINSQLEHNTLSISPKEIWQWLLFTDQLLGLKFDEIKIEEIPQQIQELLTKRQLARENKDWQASDNLRDELKQLGYKVEDTSKGQEIEKI